MIHLYDLEHRKVKGLDKYKDFYIESTLSTGDKVLSFLYPLNLATDIKEESYIRTKDNEFVVKELNTQGSWQMVTATLNVEDLEGKEWEHFDTTEQTIQQCISLALAGTGWTIGTCNVTRRRTVRKTNCNSWDIIQEAKKRYRVEIEFDALNKKVNIAENLGRDKGVYFSDSLNIKSLNIQRNSYDFYTRIIAKGKDDLKVTLENFQYSKKKKTLIWKDERYTDINSLTEDAKAKLEELSKPYRAYAAEILDLAKISDKYKDILDYKLGDTITLLSKSNGIREKQRIVKIREYPEEPSRNTCEIANTTLRFEDVQRELEDTNETVNNITTDNGTIDGSTVDDIKTEQISDFQASVAKITNLEVINASIKNLQVDKADINSLHVVEAKIGTIEATYAKITDLNVANANIENLKVGKADITQLNAVSAKVNVLEASTAEIKTLVAGNITAENIQSNFLQVLQGWMLEGSIGNAQISDLNANKIRSGTIDTSLVTVAGPGGRLRLLGNKLQVFDSKNGTLYERIMLGIDSNNNSSLTLRGADGTTVLLTQDGLTKAGFTDGYNKIDNGSLDGVKLDINSVVRSLNGATEKIESIVVNVGNKTLDVLLQEQTNTITEHGKSLSTQEARITANESAIRLKVDNQTYTTDKTTINKSIETTLATSKTYADTKKNEAISAASTDATTKANEAKTTAISTAAGDATSKANAAKDSAINTASADATSKANSAKDTAIAEAQKKADKALADSKVYINQEITTVNSSLSKATSDISVLKGQIALKVEQNDIDKTVTTVKNELVTKIDGIEVGGRNLLASSYVTRDGNTKDGYTSSDWAGTFIPQVNLIRFLEPETQYTIKYKFMLQSLADGTTAYNQNAHGTLFLYSGVSGYPSIALWDSSIDTRKEADSWVVGSIVEREATFITPKTLHELTAKYRFLCYTRRSMNGSTFVNVEKGLFYDIKLEKGNKATDWTPAPEDIDKSIADVITTTDTKIVNAKAEIKAETDKINLSVTNLTTKTNTIETQLGDKATKSEVKTVSDKATSIEANLNGISQRVSSTESNISAVTSTANTALSNANKGISDAKAASDKAIDAQNSANQAENLAKAMNQGKMLYTDPNFRQGTNSMGSYASTGTLTRISKISDCPSTSTHCLEIKCTAVDGNSRITGFNPSNLMSRANAIFIEKFIAKLPIGYRLITATNSMGTGFTDKWLTSSEGTGKWETYIREIRCGSSGTFSTGGHVYVMGTPLPTTSSPFVWYLAYATVFDITDNDESINTLTTEINTTNSKVAEIKTTTDSISSRVSTVEASNTTINGQLVAQETRLKAAESKITDSSIISTVASQFYKKGETDTKYATKTQISQLDSKIINKVDVNGAISAVTQSFDKVVTDFTGQKNGKIIVQNGNFEVHDTQDNPLLRTDGGRVITSGVDVYGNNDGTMSVYGNGNKGIEIRSHNDGNVYLDFSKNSSADYHSRFLLTRNELNLLMQMIAPQFRFTGMDDWITYITVNGNFSVSGSKNCVVKSNNYGNLLINAYETAAYYFGDIGRGVIGEDGLAYIWIEDKFYETVNTSVNYEVFTQKYGEGDVYPYKMTPSYFIIKGTPGLNFAWELKAKRKGYEEKRLEKADEENLLIRPKNITLEPGLTLKEINDLEDDLLMYKIYNLI